MPFRRCGRNGLHLPALGLGLWQHFGEDNDVDEVRRIIRRAFDAGVTYFDLANNYGRPPGSAETRFRKVLASDLRGYRNEIVVASKAGYDMWPGPYGRGGTRKYIIASCEDSLRRLGLDYVDIFYSHVFDPKTPLEETAEALDYLVRSGKTLYVGISSYSGSQSTAAFELLASIGTPCLVHQASYSMFNRWIEAGLLGVLAAHGVGCVAFSVLAQGALSNKYLRHAAPAGSRAARRGGTLAPSTMSVGVRKALADCDAIARARGQSLSQLAIAWALRSPQVSCALVGVRTLRQLEHNLAALHNLAFSSAELRAIEDACGDVRTEMWQPVDAPVLRRTDRR